MNTNKAAYWIALGVFALALNSEYQHGSFVPLHRVAACAGVAVRRIATRAEQSLAVATGRMSRRGLPVDDLLASADGAEMARAQSELLREQARDQAELLRDRVREQVREQLRKEIRARADVIRAQAEMQRAEIEQMRWHTRSQFSLARTADRRVMVVCPKTGVRVAVKDGSNLAEGSPEIDVEDSD